MKNPVLLLLLLFCTQISWAQKFSDLSPPEKKWVIFHPLAGLKAKKITQRTQAIMDSLSRAGDILDGIISGGQTDAFRHGLWMIMLCQRLGPQKAYDIGYAHEKGGKWRFEKGQTEHGLPADSMDMVMDLINNQLGIELALKWKERGQNPGMPEIISVLKQHIESGKFKVLLNDRKGNFYTCGQRFISGKKESKSWSSEKCLVPSNIYYTD
jgi:hypothetical protein